MSQTSEQSAAGAPGHPSEPQTAAFEPVQWFGTEPATPYGPPPAPPADSAFTRRDRGDRPRRRYLDIALSAVVAAVVAAGTTAVVVGGRTVTLPFVGWLGIGQVLVRAEGRARSPVVG